jgi:signal transduction histidine kinase
MVGGIPGDMRAMAEDAGGNLWMAHQSLGIFRLSPGNQSERIPWTTVGRDHFVTALAADPLRGGLWLGFYDGGVAYLKDGQVRASYTAADGLGEGYIGHLRIDRDGGLWAATQGGLIRLKDGRVATLNSRNGLPCDAVNWSVEDDDHSLWLYADCDLLRIPQADIEAWTADSKHIVTPTVFDNSDGVRLLSVPNGYSPLVAKSSDGKLWFLPTDGVSVIDPRHLPVNNLPPLVHVEQVTADRKTYDAASYIRLPPHVRDLEIDYTALSFVAPEKVLFRYKLEGRDRDWQDVGNRRQAFYSDLAPGNYRFHVTACNNSGVWNEAGTFLDFSISPAYYQTNWFRASCVAAFMLLLWGLYWLRLAQVAREFNAGLEARVNERTRIARELHDTLLQSFHGLLLRFQAVSNLLPERPAEAKQRLESAVDRAAQAIAEGRDAVQDLRSSTVVTNGLAVTINALGKELAARDTRHDCAIFRVAVEGTPRNLHPILRDEVYRIAGEALRNAFNHAQAGQIEVEIHYDDRELRLRIRDDGKGIEPIVLGEKTPAGHFGLHGMRERAKIAGGQLEVWSELDSGTEIELFIPASVAYLMPPTSRRSWFSRKRKAIKS